MLMSGFSLRSYVFIDRMQPQSAAHVAATCQGDIPVAGMSELFVEVAPGNEVFRVMDVALKAADVRPALQVVEREFGLLEVHAHHQAEVLAAGDAILGHLGLAEGDRVKPQIASAQFVTNVSPYQAQLINKWRKGNLLMAGSSLFVLEVAPAAYATLAANEAEKAANITIVEVRALGRFGRVFLSGTESEVLSARDAAVLALEQMEGKQ
jgi:ethanolamine utilization microcompartment shell protein EutL